MPLFTRAFIAGAALLSAGLAAPAFGACRDVRHLGETYLACSFDPATSDIRLYNKDQAGVPFRSFRALSLELRRREQYLVFAMNGGMYHEDLAPVGLHVEEGAEQAPLNTNPGWGNFHMLPNGVFYVGDGKAGVMAAEAYRLAGIEPRFATQSGPMLVIDGALHPRFLPDSDSLKTRNGVGVTPMARWSSPCRNGRCAFTISRPCFATRWIAPMRSFWMARSRAFMRRRSIGTTGCFRSARSSLSSRSFRADLRSDVL